MKFMSQRPSQLERDGYHELAFILDTPHRLPWIFGLITVKLQHTNWRDLSWLWHWHLCLSLSRFSCVHVSNQVGIASSFCRHLMILLSLHQLEFNNPGLPLQVFPYIILDHHKISTSHNNYHNSVRWSIFTSIFFYIFFPSIQKNSIHKQSSSGQSNIRLMLTPISVEKNIVRFMLLHFSWKCGLTASILISSNIYNTSPPHVAHLLLWKWNQVWENPGFVVVNVLPVH